MMRIIIGLASASLVCLAGLPGFDPGQGDHRSRPTLGAIAVESGASLVGGALLGGGALFAVKAAFGSNTEPFPALLVAFGAGAIGYCTGSGLGAWAGGSALSEHGRLGGTVLGTLAGTTAGFMLFAIGSSASHSAIATDCFLVSALAAPIAGSVIGYNLSRTRDGYGVNRRVLPPALGVALTEDAVGRPVAAPRLQLVGLSI